MSWETHEEVPWKTPGIVPGKVIPGEMFKEMHVQGCIMKGYWEDSLPKLF